MGLISDKADGPPNVDSWPEAAVDLGDLRLT
jgi:hypothetical protein